MSPSLRALFTISAFVIGATATAQAEPPLPAPRPLERALQSCYDQPSVRRPGVEAHGFAKYLVVGREIVAVHVSLPNAPALAQCLRTAVLGALPPLSETPPDGLAIGTVAIDVGGPRPKPQSAEAARQLAAQREAVQALVREAVLQGFIPESDPLVRETLGPQRTTPPT